MPKGKEVEKMLECLGYNQKATLLLDGVLYGISIMFLITMMMLTGGIILGMWG